MATITIREGQVISNQVNFYQDTCRKCGITFLFPAQFKQDLNGRQYYCPNGHLDSFVVGDTEAQKLQKELKRKEQELSERILENFRIGNELDRATKTAKRVTNKLKKIERRVTNGVCPCCNRTFKDLADHMKTKHPEQIKP